MGDGPRREAEIRLGLAAAGREEQQIDDLPVGVQRVLQPAEVEQDEGQLERPPFRLALRGRFAAILNRLALSRRASDRFVHRAEGEPRIGVRAQQFDAGRDPVTRVSRRCDQSRRRGLPRRAWIWPGIPAAWLAIQAS